MEYLIVISLLVLCVFMLIVVSYISILGELASVYKSSSLKYFCVNLLKTLIQFFYHVIILFGANGISLVILGLFGIDSALGTFVWPAVNITVLIIFVLLSRSIKKQLEKNIEPSTLFSNNIAHFLVINAGAAIVLLYRILVETRGTLVNQGWFYDFSSHLFFIFIIFNFGMMVLTIFQLSKEARYKEEALIQAAHRKYISDLEEAHKQLRIIKHDYMNIMSTFKLYIDDSDLIGLKTYYYDELEEVNKFFDNEDKANITLENIISKEVKSIILYKLYLALEKKININIEVPDLVESIGNSSAVTCQILGILLDNAIEASALSDKMIVELAIIKRQNSKAFIIRNTYNADESIAINKIFNLGYSTRGDGRGIGLSTVRDYTNRYQDLYIETKITDEFFTQTFTVVDSNRSGGL